MSSGRSTPLTGIAFKVGSVLIFLVMSSLLKASAGVPAGELVFFRSFFGVLPVVVFLAARGELRAGLKSHNVPSQIWRGLVGTLSMGLGFFALTRLPLPEAVTINYATPLVIVVFSAVFLHETVRLYRWSAVVVGLCGVVVIAWPRLTLFSHGVDSGAAIGVVAALSAACMGAVAQLLVRRLIQTERSATIVLYFLVSSSAISLLSAPFGWVMPSPLIATYLVGAGIAGGIAQILLTESYRHAEYERGGAVRIFLAGVLGADRLRVLRRRADLVHADRRGDRRRLGAVHHLSRAPARDRPQQGARGGDAAGVTSGCSDRSSGREWMMS